MSNLVQYDRMRAALVECVKIDEVARIKDQAGKLAAYARIVNDDEAARKFAELRLRAVQRLGELSLDLDKAKLAGRGTVSLPIVGKTKAQQLADVGVSTSAAQRAEQTAGASAQDRKAARVAADKYFAERRERRGQPTQDGMQAAVDETRPHLRKNLLRFRRLAQAEERPTVLAPYYITPSTFSDGIERAAALLDDMAKEDPRPSLEQAAARVRRLKDH